MKNFIKKIQTSFIFALTYLGMSPVALSAQEAGHAVLQNTTLNPDGTLNIEGANPIGGGKDNTGLIGAFNTFMSKANVIVAGVTGCLTIIMVLLFIWKCFEFAKSSSNPSARASAITGIIVFAIAAALFGSATLFTGLAYNLFR